MKKQIREVRVIDLITYAVLPVPVVLITWLLLVPLGLKLIPNVTWVVYVIAGLLTYIMTRRFAVGCVLVYKATAPLDVRDACRFYPTCSTYMIMAINKYGLIIGIIKGVRRLLRCKPPNGGIDYP